MRFRSCRLGVSAVIAGAFLTAVSRAESPRNELLRLVPEDTAFCLVIQDLRGHSAALLQSPFVEQFAGSSLGKTLMQSPELRKLDGVEKFLQANLKVTWPQVRDEILGDALVFAYRTGPPGEPEKEQGLFLLRARDEDLLTKLIDQVNSLQRKSGEIKDVQERRHQQVAYTCRIKPHDRDFYWQRGPVLMFSGQEAMLHRAIELSQQSAPPATPPLARQLQQLGADSALAALWINPRAFQADLEHKAQTAKAEEAVFLKTFQKYWKALDGIAVFASVQEDLQLGIAMRARMDELPSPARRFLSAAAEPSELLSRVPNNALFAMTGRFDVPALIGIVDEFLTDEARKSVQKSLDQSVGKAAAQEIASGLGPEWGLWLSAPSAEERAWLPQLTAAVRVRSGDQETPVDQTLRAALNLFALLAVLNHNRTHADRLSFQTTRQGDVEVSSFANDKRFPAGLQPAFAFRDGYLVLSSSPRAIGQFAATPHREPALPNEEVPLVRLSVHGWRAYFNGRREALVKFLMDRSQLAQDQVERRLASVLAVLQFIERIELNQRTHQGQATLILRVKPAQPLRKQPEK